MDLTKREKVGLLAFTIILITILSIMYYGNKDKSVEVIKNEEETENSSVDKVSYIKVYISGEIKNPGVYTLGANDRVERLIELSGGFTDTADKRGINLAKKLRDEEYILVPSKESQIQISPTYNSKESSGGKVNINTANLAELKTLDGIGDTLGQRIIDYRTQNGPFSDIKDLKKVSGIGESRYKTIENKISVY